MMEPPQGELTMDKTIATWQPGKYKQMAGHAAMSDTWKKEQVLFEITRVQAGPDEDAICFAKSPGVATWISHRLNVAADLERMLIKFAEGKSDGKELEAYVKKLRT